MRQAVTLNKEDICPTVKPEPEMLNTEMLTFNSQVTAECHVQGSAV